METIKYQIRALEGGEVVLRETFAQRSRALLVVERQIDRGRAVRIRRLVESSPERLRIEPNDVWGISPHAPWQLAAAPLHEVFLHTSVTLQLPATATVEQERAQMRSVDAIAKGRGFNGFSYNFGVPPSGRAYEGRGFLVIEAATEGFNTTSDSICMVGNTDAFEPTKAQLETAIGIIRRGIKRGAYAPGVRVREHNEVAAKACPGKFFDDEVMRYVRRQVAA